MRNIVVALMLAGLTFSGYSQDANSVDEISVKGHYLGIQANQLIRQIFNFSNSSAAVNNPYLLIYSVNASHGLGGNFSIGYNYTETNDGDAITNRVITNSDFNIRAGLEKKSRLGKHFILSAGGDLIYQSQKTETTVRDNFSGQFKTINSNNGFGFGPRLGIYYHVTERFLIATEANYYLKFLTQTFEVRPGDKEEEEVKQLQLHVPTAIFLIFKL